MEGLNLLIVEDNQLNMEIACDILGMKGVKLTCAWDGMQAVDIFTLNPEYTFDAILMDMRMPKMDGCEASSTIRASGRADAKTIPIIACTANAFSEDIAATQNAGMNAHVSKPLDFTVLEHVLAKVISNRADLKEFQEHRQHNAPAQQAPAPQDDEPQDTAQAEAQSDPESKTAVATELETTKPEPTKLESAKPEPSALEPAKPEVAAPEVTEPPATEPEPPVTEPTAVATPVPDAAAEVPAEQTFPADTTDVAVSEEAAPSAATAAPSPELPNEAQPSLAAAPEVPAANGTPTVPDLKVAPVSAPEEQELNLELHDAAEISVDADEVSTADAQAASKPTPMTTATSSALREELSDSTEQRAKANKLGGYFAKRPKRSTISVRSELDRVASELRNSK